MPRLNLFVTLVTLTIAFLCYHKADSAARNEASQTFDVYYKAMQSIEKEYVQKTERQKLLEGSLRGMVSELDQHSAYFNADQYRQLSESLDQQFGGIGIQVTLDEATKGLVVSTPLYNTPAHKAGILAGDRILKIDQESTAGFSMEDAVKRLRGEPGQPVTLTLLHPGTEEPLDVSVKREVIAVQTVQGDSYNDDHSWNYFLEGSDRIGLIRVSQFGERTAKEISAALTWLKERDVKALVIDLRNNPGGLLDASVSVCDEFVREGVIVSIQGRDASKLLSVSKATGGARFFDLPVAVLINSQSASAAEIVAACLQDHHRAIIVGERSYGKGSVQNLIELPAGNGALKLTTASYWRPSGKNIHRMKNAKDEEDWGVSPDEDFAVKVETEELRKVLQARQERDVLRAPGAAPPKPAEPVVDRQLQRAIEGLREKLTAQPPAKAA